MRKRFVSCQSIMAVSRSILVAAAAGLALAGCSTIQQNNSALLLNPSSNEQVAALVDENNQASSVNAETKRTYTLASTQEGDLDDEGEITTDLEVSDPLEGLNRVGFAVNRGIDFVAIRPASKVYGTFVPSPIRFGIRNIFNHLELPGDIVNYALQGDGENFGNSFKRLVINSTLGLGGVFDTAEHLGVDYEPTDFGLTLRKWGVGEGIYVNAPLIGPSTTRDSVGRIFDIAFLPTTYLGLITDFNFGGAIARGVDSIDLRYENGALLDNIIFASPDPYITLRSTYIQRRRAKASGNVLGAEGMDDALPVIVTSGE